MIAVSSGVQTRTHTQTSDFYYGTSGSNLSQNTTVLTEIFRVFFRPSAFWNSIGLMNRALLRRDFFVFFF